jgi:hypothetical protein
MRDSTGERMRVTFLGWDKVCAYVDRVNRDFVVYARIEEKKLEAMSYEELRNFGFFSAQDVAKAKAKRLLLQNRKSLLATCKQRRRARKTAR